MERSTSRLKSDSAPQPGATLQVTQPPMNFKALNLNVKSMPVSVDLGPMNTTMEGLAQSTAAQAQISMSAITELNAAVKTLTMTVDALLKKLGEQPAAGAKTHNVTIARDADGVAKSLKIVTG